MIKVLFGESIGAQDLCTRLSRSKGPLEPKEVKLFFDLILNISAKTLTLEQIVYGKLMNEKEQVKNGIKYEDPMFAGMTQEAKDILLNQFEEMTQAKAPSAESGPRTRTTHYDLLANMYEEVFNSRASYIITRDNDNENPYLVELALVDAFYRIAKHKITITISLLQVIQYLEPFILEAMKNILQNLVHPDGTRYFPTTMPRYVLEHEHKDYYEHPILLKYYEHEKAPIMINGYCAKIAHVFNDAFMRINELMFPQATETQSSPQPVEG